MSITSPYRGGQVWEPAGGSTVAAAGPGRASLFGALREVLLIALLYLAYSGVRLLADTHVASAVGRATSLRQVEGLVGLDFEGFLNHLTAESTWLGVSMSYWYSSLHYVVTPAVLVWVFWRHRAAYQRARNALMLASAIALLGYLLLPMAPPRLMADGYVDVLAQTAQYGWWSDHASAPVGLDGLTNEFAAMPSLHVGWAVWVAWAVATRSGRRWRALAIAYAVGTVGVVIGTGNHWVLDAVAGAWLMWFSIAATGVLHRRRSAGE